ncbi:MAG: saccharopine dehydrogenase C-terminal domain-containing protein [Thermoanaerobaculales bacterium]|nr:saccharopine dehydrogenase C-terminal domain-containing protein [Thermoanaerobaculales bacterium]
MKVVVLGCGRVGQAMVKDLATEDGWEITAIDVHDGAFEGLAGIDNVSVRRADLGDAAVVSESVAGYDMAVGAVPGPMGAATLKTVIEAGVNVVDISFFEEDPFHLHELAVERGVTAVMDCGVAPGFSNLALGHSQTVFDELSSFVCYVGGLPEVRRWPYEYAAVFSPIDVIAEYTRPARIVEKGQVVVREALSEVELLDVPGVGTLEAFNSDGLRTLLKVEGIPEMKEKTMRYPGHAERMRMLRETGFFREDTIDVGGASIRPVDVTAALMFPVWQLPEGEGDQTVMRIAVEGVLDGRKVRRTWDMLDCFDREGGVTSMARTTGYTCTAAVRALAAGLFDEPGLVPPEVLGRAPGVYEYIVDRLAERNVVFTVTDEAV